MTGYGEDMAQRDFRSAAAAKPIAFRPVEPIGAKAAVASEPVEASAPAVEPKANRTRSRAWILPVLAICALGLSWATKSSLRGMFQSKPKAEVASVAAPQAAVARTIAATEPALVLSTQPPAELIVPATAAASAAVETVTSAPLVAAKEPEPVVAAPAPVAAVPVILNETIETTTPPTVVSVPSPAPAATIADAAPAIAATPEPMISASVRSEPAPPKPARKPAAPVVNEVVCFAGCANSIDKVVYRAESVALNSRPQHNQPIVLAALAPAGTARGAQSSPSVIACVAGCYGISTNRIAAAPARRNQQQLVPRFALSEAEFATPVLTQVSSLPSKPRRSRRHR